jgi:hypothetical protein
MKIDLIWFYNNKGRAGKCLAWRHNQIYFV